MRCLQPVRSNGNHPSFLIATGRLQRIHAGLAAARARGRKGGRKPKLSADQQQLAVDMAKGGIPITTIAQTLHCSRHTVYKALAQFGVPMQPVP